MIRQIIILLSAGLLAFAVASCATSPLGRNQLSLVPASQLSQMGVQAFQEMKKEMPQARDSGLNRYVHCVAEKITREVNQGNWEVVVFQDEDPNAFALPGGKIGVHTGILKVATNQHQLATVIAHEIAHVLANHGGERVSQQLVVQTGMDLVQAVADPHSRTGQLAMAALGIGTQFGILLPYSRLQESEADLYGLDLMARAGFDPRESTALWRNMSRASGGKQPPAFLSTHPSHSSRIQDLSARMGRAMQWYEQAQRQGKRPNCGP